MNGNLLVKGLITRLKELKHTACAITDHGTLSATQMGYDEFKKAGIKFIPGVEFYIAHDRFEKKKGQGNRNNHIICLARNEKGWKNILKLNYIGYKEGSTLNYDRVVPRIDHQILEQYSEGLIILSACLAGVPQQLLLQDKYEEAQQYVRKMKKMLWDEKLQRSTYFLEVQPADSYWRLEDAKTKPIDKNWIEKQCVDQKAANDLIVRLSEDEDVDIVFTSDSHFVSGEKDSADDFEAHLLLLATQSKTTVEDLAIGDGGGRLAFASTPLLSTEKMIESFCETESSYNGFDREQVIIWQQNTKLIESLVEAPVYLERGKFKLPKFKVEEVDDYEEYIRWKNSLSQQQVDKILGRV